MYYNKLEEIEFWYNYYDGYSKPKSVSTNHNHYNIPSVSGQYFLY